MATFAERLKFLRTDRDLTRLALSKLIGVSHSSINMYERGEREPNLETLEAIADYFNVDMDYLLGRQDIPRRIDLSSRLSMDASSSLISLTSHEHDVITSYRNQPDMQPAVDRILGVESEPPKIPDLMYDDYELSSTIQKAAQTPVPYTKEQPSMIQLHREGKEYKMQKSVRKYQKIFIKYQKYYYQKY